MSGVGPLRFFSKSVDWYRKTWGSRWSSPFHPTSKTLACRGHRSFVLWFDRIPQNLMKLGVLMQFSELGKQVIVKKYLVKDYSSFSDSLYWCDAKWAAVTLQKRDRVQGAEETESALRRLGSSSSAFWRICQPIWLEFERFQKGIT